MLQYHMQKHVCVYFLVVKGTYLSWMTLSQLLILMQQSDCTRGWCRVFYSGRQYCLLHMSLRYVKKMSVSGGGARCCTGEDLGILQSGFNSEWCRMHYTAVQNYQNCLPQLLHFFVILCIFNSYLDSKCLNKIILKMYQNIEANTFGHFVMLY